MQNNTYSTLVSGWQVIPCPQGPSTQFQFVSFGRSILQFLSLSSKDSILSCVPDVCIFMWVPHSCKVTCFYCRAHMLWKTRCIYPMHEIIIVLVEVVFSSQYPLRVYFAFYNLSQVFLLMYFNEMILLYPLKIFQFLPL